jgi:hypothetical protein
LPHGAKIMFLHDYSKDCNRLFGLTPINHQPHNIYLWM